MGCAGDVGPRCWVVLFTCVLTCFFWFLVLFFAAPDSSRYWIADTYDAAMSEGGSGVPGNIDKEFVRLWYKERYEKVSVRGSVMVRCGVFVYSYFLFFLRMFF